MFLTTEPHISWRNYHVIRIIHTARVIQLYASDTSKIVNDLDSIIEFALGDFQNEATNLGADGVIGVHHATSVDGSSGTFLVVTMMGTAIKFD